jgi:cytochrome c peroxidase
MRIKGFYLGGIIVLVILFLAAKPIKIYKLDYPDYWPKPAYKFEKKPLTKDGIFLGRKLFYDPILSLDSTISCASCHLSYTAFTHVDHKLSHGIKDKIGNRNAMSLVNLAWNTSFMWDGASHALDVQALRPITDSLEMGETLANVILKLRRSSFYPDLFEKAFNDTVKTANLLNALAQFQLTFVSSNSKYDKVKSGESVFNDQELRGYNLFLENCNSCHTAPLFTNFSFKSNGIEVDPKLNDLGRFAITENQVDSFKFKVPSLRNIEYAYPYMHDGRYRNLKQVLKHYANNSSKHVDLKLRNLELSDADQKDLISFLLTLTDKTFLFDKKFAYPR